MVNAVNRGVSISLRGNRVVQVSNDNGNSNRSSQNNNSNDANNSYANVAARDSTGGNRRGRQGQRGRCTRGRGQIQNRYFHQQRL